MSETRQLKEKALHQGAAQGIIEETKMTVESNLVVKNAFLEGNFCPTREEVSLPCVEVEGEIPPELEGCFLRIGPNPQFVPDVNLYHWFDGDGMIHEIQFKQGKAHYQNKWIETKGYLKEKEKGDWIWRGINSPPDFANPDGPMKNPANTAFVWNNDRLLALWEGGEPYEIKLPSLETVGIENFGNKLSGYPYSAHPKVDPETGDMIACGYFMAAPPYAKHFVVDKQGKMLKETPIQLPKGIIMHDCAITKRYTVILDLPLTFDLALAMKGKKPINWEPSNGARIGLLDRQQDTHPIQWFDINPGMVFHVMNAYEEGDEVIVEACRSNKTTMLQERMNPEEELAFPHQWRLNLVTGEVKEQRISKTWCEFPRINENKLGRKYRFCWASRFAGTDTPLFDALVRFDRKTNTETVYELGAGRYVGEAVFAPKINPTTKEVAAEDSGWIIGFVWDENKQQSECIIMDAQDYTKGPIATLKMPVRVPYGFHTGWVGADLLSKQR